MNITRVLAIVAFALLACAARIGAAENGVIYASSDGIGNISLFWFPPVGALPVGGWRIVEDGSSGERVLVERVLPGEAGALAEISPADRRYATTFKRGARPAANGTSTTLAYGLFAMHVFNDAAFARAVGLARTVRAHATGTVRYRVLALGANGTPEGLAFTSVPIDAHAATRRPLAPERLRAVAQTDGVALAWAPAPRGASVPVMSYEIERKLASGVWAPLSTRPILFGERNDGALHLLDPAPPRDIDVAYRAIARDLFGARSVPANVTVFATDVRALAPLGLEATARAGGANLRWTPRANVHTAGYFLERAHQASGPYESLTPHVLVARTATFVDPTLKAGATYFYRIRAVNARGIVGEPSRPALVTIAGAEPPGAPQSLRAAVGRTRVRLAWTRARGQIAGYLVFRRRGTVGLMRRLTPTLTPFLTYDDTDPPRTGDALTYRIVSVAFDNAHSTPRDTDVRAFDASTIAPPLLLSIVGTHGRVTLAFRAATRMGSLRVAIFRSRAASLGGDRIGDVDAAQGRYEDTTVRPGERYWYRLITIDTAGRASAQTAGYLARAPR